MNNPMNTDTQTALIIELDTEDAEQAEAAAKAQALLQEEADVGAWQKRIDAARDFDKDARKGYATDRMYCRNRIDHEVYDVSVPIAGTYVNLLTSFLYARDPEPSVVPAESAGPSRINDAKQLAKTLEIVIARLWKKGRLKAASDQLVRSGLTIGIGWIKAAWHRETEKDPTTVEQINGIRDQLERLMATERQIEDGYGGDINQLRAQYEQQMAALEAKVDVVTYNGLWVDFVRGEDIQVSQESACLKDYVMAPWIAHRSFMTLDDGKAAYPELCKELGNATTFYQVRQDDRSKGFVSATDRKLDASAADAFTSADSVSGTKDESACPHICIWEVWDRKTGSVITFAQGLKRYLRPTFVPDQQTSRFYPFFQWAPLWVDGERHPQSLVDRSRSLLDEYNRIRTNYREHRRRAIPKLGFDAGAVEPGEAEKMKGGSTGEMIGLNLNGQTSQSVLFPIQYNQIDPALYDTAVIRAELELIWGIQEALSSTINTPKTATESGIQQQGTESRLGYARDSLDDMYGELAQYSAESGMSPAGLSQDEVVEIAGPEALWPTLQHQDVESLVAVDIRAGSSGRPMTNLRRQQWGAILPQLQQAVLTIGQMRGAPPAEIANSLEQLMVETIERTGDTSIDAYSFIPQAPEPLDGMSIGAMPANDPMAAQQVPPGAMPPQGMPPAVVPQPEPINPAMSPAA